jgi:hypothetical protein
VKFENIALFVPILCELHNNLYDGELVQNPKNAQRENEVEVSQGVQ